MNSTLFPDSVRSFRLILASHTSLKLNRKKEQKETGTRAQTRTARR